MSRNLCPEYGKKRFRFLRSVFILLIVISGTGIAFFLYYVIGSAVVFLQNEMGIERRLIIIDATPPYVAIILVAVFIISIFGLRNTTKAERAVC